MQDISEDILLKNEAYALNIPFDNGLDECLLESKYECKKIKKELFVLWMQLKKLSDDIYANTIENKEGSLENIIFLQSVKKAFILSLCFNELKEVSNSIEKLFNLDISRIDKTLISFFNEIYLSIKCNHIKLIHCIYKIKILKRMQLTCSMKIAGISGPWSNLDLPLKERVWEWYDDGDEEWFKDRTEARQKQPRYNPEKNSFGIYFSFEDYRRSPYLFGDEDEDIYPHSNHIRIADRK